MIPGCFSRTRLRSSHDMLPVFFVSADLNNSPVMASIASRGNVRALSAKHDVSTVFSSSSSMNQLPERKTKYLDKFPTDRNKVLQPIRYVSNYCFV